MMRKTTSKKKLNPQQSSSDKTREKILRAARKLFLSSGFKGTSLSHIAKSANVTQSLVSHHFGSKQRLWQRIKTDLLDEYFASIEQELTSHQKNKQSKPTLESTIHKTLNNRFHLLKNHPDLVRLGLWQQLDNYTQHSTPRGHDLLHTLIKKINQAQKSGEIRKDINPSMLTVIMFILSSGWFQQNYQWILEIDKTTPQHANQAEAHYLETIQKILSDGLKPLQ